MSLYFLHICNIWILVIATATFYQATKNNHLSWKFFYKCYKTQETYFTTQYILIILAVFNTYLLSWILFISLHDIFTFHHEALLLLLGQNSQVYYDNLKILFDASKSTFLMSKYQFRHPRACIWILQYCKQIYRCALLLGLYANWAPIPLFLEIAIGKGEA